MPLQNIVHGRAVVVALLLAGCAQTRAPLPIAVPRVPDLVLQAESTDPQVRATIVGGQAPVPVLPTASAPPQPGDIAINLPNADSRVVAKAVLTDILRVPFSVAPGVTARVSLVTPGPVARSALLGLFETALRNAGLALTPAGGGFQIDQITNAQAAGTVTATTVGYGTELIRLQFISAAQVKTLLDSVVPGVVTAVDTVTNSVTIAGTTGQRTSARDLLRQFDVNWLRNMTFALFVPQRTDSRLIAPELEKLINASDSPTRGLVRLITMERLNGILAISQQPQYLEDVRRWIEILDREGESNEAKLFVYRVQNGRARDLARTLNNAFGGGSGEGAPSSADPFANPGTSGSIGETQLPGAPPPNALPQPLANGQAATAANANAQPATTTTARVGRITSDDVNNAVIVYGTPREYSVVEDALRKLDILPFQVLIEAAITEVTLTDELRYGVQWRFNAGNADFALSDNATVNPARIVPGFSFFLSNTDISATLNALEERTNVKVVSAPKLLVLNNQTAALQVGDQVPVQTTEQQSTQNADAPIVNSIEYRDTGVILKVTPRVNAGGLVLLDIAQEVSDIAGAVTGSSSPVISTRRISTSIAAQDGQVIALGGLFRDNKVFGKNGLPILSRIPILGGLLFGNTRNTQNRTELIVLLKPTVLRTIDDGRAITEELRSKLRTLEPFKTEGRIP